MDPTAPRQLMEAFAERTGLSSDLEPRRYLWTDAFAVCNFLGLYRHTGEERYRRLARDLVDQVHRVLGRHRDDDPREGWLSGLDDEEGWQHPTAGGLRIGKKLNERGPNEPFDERLEWDRDGQYFHYLTKWMHALDQMTRATGDLSYLRWARELARVAHQRFNCLPAPGGGTRMAWKMSIDLSRPLVPTTGHHDPLDGLVTCLRLRSGVSGDPGEAPGPDLGPEVAELDEMCRGRNWTTDDPLGLGGLLFDAHRLAQLSAAGDVVPAGLLTGLLDSSLPGLASWTRGHPLELPAEYRLAFRELGLAIGLKALPSLREFLTRHPNRFHPSLSSRIDVLMRHLPWSERIERFWTEAPPQRAATWTEHREINTVMLATTLAPDGFLAP